MAVSTRCFLLALTLFPFSLSKDMNCSSSDQSVLKCTIEEKKNACGGIDDIERIETPISAPVITKAEMFIGKYGFPGIDVSWRASSPLEANQTVGYRLKFVYTSLNGRSYIPPKEVRCRHAVIWSTVPSLNNDDITPSFNYRLQAINRTYLAATMYVELSALPYPLYSPKDVDMKLVTLKADTTSTTTTTPTITTHTTSYTTTSTPVTKTDSVDAAPSSSSSLQLTSEADVVYGLWWHHTLTSLGAVFLLLVIVIVVAQSCAGRQGQLDISSDNQRKFTNRGSDSSSVSSVSSVRVSIQYQDDRAPNKDFHRFCSQTVYSRDPAGPLHGPLSTNSRLSDSHGAEKFHETGTPVDSTGGFNDAPTFAISDRIIPALVTQRSTQPLLNISDEDSFSVTTEAVSR